MIATLMIAAGRILHEMDRNAGKRSHHAGYEIAKTKRVRGTVAAAGITMRFSVRSYSASRQIIVRGKPASATHRRTSTDEGKVASPRCQQRADNYGTAIVWTLVCKPSDAAADGRECSEQAPDRLPARR